MASAAGTQIALQVFSSSAKRVGTVANEIGKINAVAGTHADGTIGALRCARPESAALRRIAGLLPPNRLSEEIAAALRSRPRWRIAGRNCSAPSASSTERRWPSRSGLNPAAAAAQALQVGGDLVEIGAHLLDLGVDRPALRRLAIEQREESGTVAAHALGLHGARDRVRPAAWPGSPHNGGSGRPCRGIAATAVSMRGKLALQPLAHRIGAEPDSAGCGRAGRPAATTPVDRRQRTQKCGAGEDAATHGTETKFQACPPF